LNIVSLFISLEERNILDRNNPKHLYAVWTIFGPLIQHSLNVFQESWNNHSLSKFGIPGKV
jgi:hypothetical protein